MDGVIVVVGLGFLGIGWVVGYFTGVHQTGSAVRELLDALEEKIRQ